LQQAVLARALKVLSERSFDETLRGI